MSRAIDTSFTLLESGAAVDVGVFSDPGRHIVIRDAAVAEALRRAILPETPRKMVRVGGGSAETEVSFHVLDLRRDRALSREIARLLHGAFVDATAGALKSATDKDGFLDPAATRRLDAVEDVIELRRFIANAKASRPARPRRELLFHHAMPEAAE